MKAIICKRKSQTLIKDEKDKRNFKEEKKHLSIWKNLKNKVIDEIKS